MSNLFDDASQTLQYKTWILKVSIHCEGCKKQVKKILQNIEGVYKTEIDSLQHKAIVTGNVDSGTLIKKLLKNGKHAELWPEDSINKEQKQGKSKKNKGKKGPINGEKIDLGYETKDLMEKGEDLVKESPEEQMNQPKEHPDEKIPDKAPGGDQMPKMEENDVAAAVDAQAGGPSGGNGGKKKKHKAPQNGGMADVEVADGEGVIRDAQLPVKETPILGDPLMSMPIPRQHGQPYQPPPAYFQPPEYGISYNASYPSMNSSSYYSPPMHSYAYFGPASHPPPPPSNLIRPISYQHDYNDYDEDESGCIIM